MDESTAFNQGSDARLRGEPLLACPYDPAMSRAWYRGWRDVDANLGADVKRRKVKSLPVVQDVEHSA